MGKRQKGNSIRQESIFKGVLLANFVLVFHVALILCVAFIAFFSGGVIEYLPWIIGSAGLLIAVSAYLCWRRFKKQGKHLKDILQDPSIQNRSIEVSFLGGFASLRLGAPQETTPLIQSENLHGPAKQLEAPDADHRENPTNLQPLLNSGNIAAEHLKAPQQTAGDLRP